MKKMIVFLKKKEGMSFEDFRNHYENIHVPLCGERIGHLIENYRRYYPQNLNNLYHGRPDSHAGREGGTSYDAVAVYTIKSEEALEELIRIGQDPEFQQILSEDEERFCDRAITMEGVADEFFGPGLNG